MIIEEERAGFCIEPDHAEKECEVADPGGDECFFCRSRRARFMVPETDEQVRGESDQFPTDEKEQQAVCDDHPEHRRSEKGQKTEEPREVFVMSHVASAIDEDEQADE